ncbi:hypothetical protein ACFQL4_23155 [Halosimplex aquaticum]
MDTNDTTVDENRRKTLKYLGIGSLSTLAAASSATGSAGATSFNDPDLLLTDDCFVDVDSDMGWKYDYRRNHSATLGYWGPTWDETQGKWEHSFEIHGSAYGEMRCPGYACPDGDGKDWNEGSDFFQQHSIVIEDGAPSLNVGDPYPLNSSSHEFDVAENDVSARPSPEDNSNEAEAAEAMISYALGELNPIVGQR